MDSESESETETGTQVLMEHGYAVGGLNEYKEE